jgi:hypothetical protein
VSAAPGPGSAELAAQAAGEDGNAGVPGQVPYEAWMLAFDRLSPEDWDDLPVSEQAKWGAIEQAAVNASPELAKLQQACQTLGMVVERQARDLYAMWVDVSRGDLEAVRERVLNAIPDVDDNEPGEQWNGTETGDEWFDRTREGL